MITIENKSQCCGCSACFSVCPQQCISMKKDEEGFFYPQVEKNLCVECGVCEKVCPVLHTKKGTLLPQAYAFQIDDEASLYDCAAGGAFFAIGKKIIEQGGYVFGAAYDKDLVVRHMMARTVSELEPFRSSKYVQSDPSSCFKQVKGLLEEKKLVCYSGTPCQIAGLKAFLRKDYENLVTIDLVCKGVSSPEVFRQYISKMKTENGDIQGVNFKRKTYGYHSSTMSVDFTNGGKYSRGGITDLMMRSFRANICLRPSCTECAFKTGERVSDLTLFDCWHYTELTGKKDNDKGHTSILVHSEKGAKLIELCKDIASVDLISAEEAIHYDGIMVNNRVKNHDKRKEFFVALNQNGFEAAVQKCIPVSAKERMMDSSKVFLHKTGLMKVAKKVLGRQKIK